jgi:hypothetical protein
LGLPVPVFPGLSKGGRPPLPPDQRLSPEEARERQRQSRARSRAKHRDRLNAEARERTAALQHEVIARRAARAAARAQYRLDHADEIREQKRAYWRAYHAANLETFQARQRAYRASLPIEVRRAKWRAWVEANPDEARAKDTMHRASRKGASVTERISPREVFERDNWTCYLCDNEVESADATIDHVIPLSRGGQHIRSNVRCAHLRCNIIKKDRLLDELSAVAFRLTDTACSQS